MRPLFKIRNGENMKILFIGDIYGRPGREILFDNLDRLKEKYKPNIIIVNGENSAHGRSITKKIYKEMMISGIHLVTMGNHTFSNRDIHDLLLDPDINIIRPCNYRNTKGNGYKVINYNGVKLLVINALGRAFMNNSVDNPFYSVKEIIEKVPHDYSFVDFHAEATAEKVALGHYLDGYASVVVGTHTHIPTADERKLPKGTLYITDVGMTGPLNGIIGVDKNIVIPRFLNGHSRPNEVAKGARWLNGVIVDLELKTIERIQIYED